mgnify:CR=1 FL=1
MVPGVVRARYDFPLIHEGVLALEAVKRALISPNQRGALKISINSASCPEIGQVRPIVCTFKYVSIQDRHTCKTRAMCVATVTAWRSVPDK